jgi:hypothetical protein
MDEFKVELFKKEYKGKVLNYISVSEINCKSIQDNISKRFNIDSKSLFDFVEKLSAKQTPIEGVDANEMFNLKDVLGDLLITPQLRVYVNWYRFDEIDQFNIDDFEKYFDDIWFAGSDDIDIFDDSLKWILSIRHDGLVSILK